MSWGNTTSPAKFQGIEPKFKVGWAKCNKGNPMLHLTHQQETEFKLLFPVTINAELMKMFGVGSSTIHRWARRLGLKKDEEQITRQRRQHAKESSQWYYDTLKGKTPKVIELMKTDKEYGKRVKAKQTESLKRTSARERVRIRLGLPRLTNLPMNIVRPKEDCYTKQQQAFRGNVKNRLHYIISTKEDERHTIFYDEHTIRRPKVEKFGETIGFHFVQFAVE